MNIDVIAADSYLLIDLSYQPEGYDCCVACETDPYCRASIFRLYGGGCYKVRNTQSTCNPAAVAASFYSGSSLKGTIYNSNCGQWSKS